MAQLDSYIRGVDSIELQLTLEDEDGDPIDTDTLDEITVEIITKKKGIPENDVYWTGTVTGGTVEETTPASGIITCYIDYQSTEDWPISLRYWARTTIEQTDADFTSGIKVSVSDEPVFRLRIA